MRIPNSVLRFPFSKTIRLLFVVVVISVGVFRLSQNAHGNIADTSLPHAGTSPVAEVLSHLAVKGRAPKTGYERALFSAGWASYGTCDMRNVILARDLEQIAFVPGTCKVNSGVLNDSYTNTIIHFVRGPDTSDDVQIDHVVALSDAWQKGAQQLTPLERYALANDPLNLLATDGKANQNKGDSDAASWLPPNKAFRCAYVARQVAVKSKYNLWVTVAEYQAMARVIVTCPTQQLPSGV